MEVNRLRLKHPQKIKSKAVAPVSFFRADKKQAPGGDSVTHRQKEAEAAARDLQLLQMKRSKLNLLSR